MQKVLNNVKKVMVMSLWNMGNKLAFMTIVAAIPSFGLAANLVTNSSFETGITGWTATGACTWESLTANTYTNPGNFRAPAPTDGARTLLSDTTQADMGFCTLYQDVAIPAGGSSSLTLAAGYKVWNYGEGSAATCSASVEVTTTAGAPIATVYSATGPSAAAMAPRPALDLTAKNGSTVRLIIKANSCNSASFSNRALIGAVVDNVVLDYTAPAAIAATVSSVPTLSEWGLMILAALMVLLMPRARRGRSS